MYNYDDLSEDLKERLRDSERDNLEQEMLMFGRDLCEELEDEYGVDVDKIYLTDPYSQGFTVYIEDEGCIIKDQYEFLMRALSKKDKLDRFNKLQKYMEDYDLDLDIKIKMVHAGGGRCYNSIEVMDNMLMLEEDLKGTEEYENIEDLLEEITGDLERYLQEDIIGYLKKRVREEMDSWFLEDYKIDSVLRNYMFDDEGRMFEK